MVDPIPIPKSPTLLPPKLKPKTSEVEVSWGWANAAPIPPPRISKGEAVVVTGGAKIGGVEPFNE